MKRKTEDETENGASNENMSERRFLGTNYLGEDGRCPLRKKDDRKYLEKWPVYVEEKKDCVREKK